MCSTDILCPICGETNLRKIKIAGGKQETSHSEKADFRSFYICFTCKMTFFEEDMLKKQSKRLD
jgi:transposase-like protein